MNKISYSGYRFPPEIIQQAIWLYLRFTLSLRDVEDLLAERGVAVSYETVRRWVNHFGPMIAAELRKRRQKPHTTWHLDEVYLKIDGRMVYLCGNCMDEAAEEHRDAGRDIVPGRIRVEPGKSRAIVGGARGVSVDDLAETMGVGGAEAVERALSRRAQLAGVWNAG